MVSTISHLRLHYPLLETKRHRQVIVNFPDSNRGIRFAASLFDTALQFCFLEFNSQFDDLRLLRRGPVGFLDDDFDGGVAFAPPLVIANASADQLSVVMFEKLLLRFSDPETMFAELS